MASDMAYVHVAIPLKLTTFTAQADILQNYLFKLSRVVLNDTGKETFLETIRDIARFGQTRLNRLKNRVKHIDEILPFDGDLTAQQRQRRTNTDTLDEYEIKDHQMFLNKEIINPLLIEDILKDPTLLLETNNKILQIKLKKLKDEYKIYLKNTKQNTLHKYRRSTASFATYIARGLQSTLNSTNVLINSTPVLNTNTTDNNLSTASDLIIFCQNILGHFRSIIFNSQYYNHLRTRQHTQAEASKIIIDCQKATNHFHGIKYAKCKINLNAHTITSHFNIHISPEPLNIPWTLDPMALPADILMEAALIDRKLSTLEYNLKALLNETSQKTDFKNMLVMDSPFSYPWFIWVAGVTAMLGFSLLIFWYIYNVYQTRKHALDTPIPNQGQTHLNINMAPQDNKNTLYPVPPYNLLKQTHTTKINLNFVFLVTHSIQMSNV